MQRCNINKTDANNNKGKDRNYWTSKDLCRGIPRTLKSKQWGWIFFLTSALYFLNPQTSSPPDAERTPHSPVVVLPFCLSKGGSPGLQSICREERIQHKKQLNGWKLSEYLK